MGQRILLIGMMGAGKTSIGQAVAEALHLPCISLDQVFTETMGEPIASWMTREGEAAFREAEHQVAQSIASSWETGVVDTGGGFVTYPANRDLFRDAGDMWIWVQRDMDDIWESLRGDTTRPLATSKERLKMLYEAREALYASWADYVLPPQPIAQSVQQIVAWWEERKQLCNG